MRYWRRSFGISLTIDPDTCAVCGEDLNAGRHDPVETCPGIFGSETCSKPEEHHLFRRRLVPVTVKRENVW